MRWLITGGAGFIGTNLYRRLEELGEEVFVVDLKGRYGVPVQALDVCHLGKLSKVFEQVRPHYVVHLASPTSVHASYDMPVTFVDTMVRGTLNVLLLSAKSEARQVFYASSCAASNDWEGVSPYGAAKWVCEQLCHAHSRVPTVVLRFSNVYGPYSMHKESVVARFAQALVQGRNLEVHGNGYQARDFIHVDDIVNRVIVRAQGRAVAKGVQTLSTGEQITIRDLAATMHKMAFTIGIDCGKSRIVNTPYPSKASIRTPPPEHGEIRNPVPLSRGLIRTLTWYRQWMKNRG